MGWGGLFQALVLSCFKNLGNAHQQLELDVGSLKSRSDQDRRQGSGLGTGEPKAPRPTREAGTGAVPEDTQLQAQVAALPVLPQFRKAFILQDLL